MPLNRITKAFDNVKKAAEAALKKADMSNQTNHNNKTSTAFALMNIIKTKLKAQTCILASNREPYMHIYDGNKIKCIKYASGLTIALDSVASICKGIWVASGSGKADKEVVDKHNKISVPPHAPKYTLKRVWLSKEEENGYYYGFSNEVLWPLCHLVYVRPKFNEKQWHIYKKVNKKFAEAIIEEIKSNNAIILLQDYHLALCAKYIKEKLPKVTTVLFWHIPWPNPEIFRICPWKNELLEGLLSNNILGFHLPYHTDNFMKTVSCEMEARISYENNMIIKGNKKTHIKAYPISCDFEKISRLTSSINVSKKIEKIKIKYHLKNKKILLGIDRIDYTKGIPERLYAINRFLEKYPKYKSQFIFIQIGVPSRTHLEEYKNVSDDIEKLIEDINWRHSTENWHPIIFIKGQQDFSEVLPFYKLADICIVSSLHDGMNLVAKEYISVKDDLNGVLILSKFAGASRELEQALLINPYDIEKFSNIIKQAFDMPIYERKKRMARMRENISEHNVYHWVINIISDIIKLHTGEITSYEESIKNTK